MLFKNEKKKKNVFSFYITRLELGGNIIDRKIKLINQNRFKFMVGVGLKKSNIYKKSFKGLIKPTNLLKSGRSILRFKHLKNLPHLIWIEKPTLIDWYTHSLLEGIFQMTNFDVTNFHWFICFVWLLIVFFSLVNKWSVNKENQRCLR